MGFSFTRIIRRIRDAWQRAWLLPLRLLMLLLSIGLLLTLLLSAARHTEALQAREQAARLFTAWPLWALNLPTDDDPRMVWRQPRWRDSNWLAQRMLSPDAPATAMTVQMAPLARHVDERLGQYLPQWLVNAGSGLPLWSTDGLPACAWLGSTHEVEQRPGAEWLLGSNLRCRVIPSPPGWQALRYEMTGATLLIRAEHAALMLGAGWLDAADTVYAGHAGDCPSLRREASLPVTCHPAGASRSATALSTPRLGQLQDTSLLLGLVAAGLSLLIYVHGLGQSLSQELALRAALGIPPQERLGWLLSETALQWAWVTFPPAGLLLLAHTMGGLRLPAPTHDVLLTVWLISGGLVMVMAALPAMWRLPKAMAQLGKLG